MTLEGEVARLIRGGATSSRTLELTELEQVCVFTDVAEPPVLSALCDFSAPVRLVVDRPCNEMAFMMAHDADPFNCWDAGQTLAQE